MVTSGNQWFSSLDQGKAYHQGFVTDECKHMTAFVALWGLYVLFVPGYALLVRTRNGFEEGFRAATRLEGLALAAPSSLRTDYPVR